MKKSKNTGEERPTRVTFVSATCRDTKLIANFQVPFNKSLERVTGKPFKLSFFGSAKGPKELLENADVIFVDPVTTWSGRNKTLASQLRKVITAEKAETRLFILPRKRIEKENFFLRPMECIGILVPEFESAKNWASESLVREVKFKKAKKQNYSPMRISVVSATSRDPKIAKPFLEGLKAVMGESWDEIKLEIINHEVSPQVLVGDSDLIAIDSVVTYGGGKNKTMLPMIRSIIKGLIWKTNVFVLPRKVSDRKDFFAQPERFANILLSMLKTRGFNFASEVTEKKGMNGDKKGLKVLDVSTTAEDEAISVPEALVPVNVLISLSTKCGHVDRGEAKELKQIARRILSAKAKVTVLDEKQAREVTDADIVITSVRVTTHSIPQDNHNRDSWCNRGRGRRSEPKIVVDKNLDHVFNFKKKNPNAQIIALDQMLSYAVFKHMMRISSFLQQPVAEASLRFALRKAIKTLAKSRELERES